MSLLEHRDPDGLRLSGGSGAQITKATSSRRRVELRRSSLHPRTIAFRPTSHSTISPDSSLPD